MSGPDPVRWHRHALAATLVALVALSPVVASATTETTDQAPTQPLEDQLIRFQATIDQAVANYTDAYEAYHAAEDADAREEAREAMVDAGHRVGTAFLTFEQGHGVETSLSTFMQTEMPSRFYQGFERHVILLRATMLQAQSDQPASLDEVDAQATLVDRALDRTAQCLPEGCGSSLATTFAQSFFVVLREGFEAILLVGAMVAFLHKSDRPESQRYIWTGVGAAVLASLAAWVLLQRLLGSVQAAGASQQLVEGVTMLLAAAVLFYVSYWLLGKVEARNWQAFLDGKLRANLAEDRAWMLGVIGFLAVFREGLETVLFVKALSIQSQGAWGEILLGLGLGLAAVALLYMAIHRLGVRIPLRSFFAVTSGILAFMAIRFTGLGIFELQEGGLLQVTPLHEVAAFLTSHPILGVLAQDVAGFSPTLEVLVSQGLILGALAAGGAYTWLTSQPDPSPA